MKAVIRKSSSLDLSSKKRTGSKHTLRHFPNTSLALPIKNTFIQRKPLCPCDGSCPRCSGTIQPKLIFGQPYDKYEQEADRVADEVMRMPELPLQRQVEPEEEETLQTKPLTKQITPLVQRQAEEEEEEEEEESLQTKENPGQTPEATPDLESRIQSLKGGGQPLPKSARSFFEQRFGYYFNHVRIHNNPEAAGLARALNATAFTMGRDIVFGTGQYAPETSSGKRLLAHELTHVIQQNKYNNSRNVHGTQNPILQHALIQRPLDPSRGFSIPSSRPRASVTPGAYFYPLPVNTEQAVEAACSTVEGSPRSYEIDLFRIHGIEQTSDSLIAHATLNFFSRHFQNVFILLYFVCRSDVNSDFPDDPERAEEEFNHVIADQVYRLHLFPVAEEYFLNHPDRLRQLRQRRTPRVRRGEELA
jgi:hypothetical protein